MIQIFTASVAMSACVPLAAAAACNDYDFELEASPSFLAPSMTRVHAGPHSSGISVVIGDDKLVEKLPLNAAAADEFCTRMQQAITIDQSKDERMGLDGINVRGHSKHRQLRFFMGKIFWIIQPAPVGRSSWR
jgi:hypothetical protein